MNKKQVFIFLLLTVFVNNIHAQITLLSEDFNSCNGALPALWQQYSVTGTDSWKCTASGYSGNGVYMNGYSGGNNNTNEDWLISPLLDLSGYSVPKLMFWCRTKFNGNPIEVRVSNNYAGSGNPNAATWSVLPAVLPATNSDSWFLSGNINLTPYKNQPCYLAFKYTSTTLASALWRVDNIAVEEGALTLTKKFVNAGQCAAGYFSTGNSFTFTMSGLAANLDVNAPQPFQLSKDNINFASQLTYNAAANGIPQVVYARINPAVADKVYRDSITFTYNGYPVKEKQYILGTSFPDDHTLRVVSWNMRWFGDPVFCNCDTTLARLNSTTVLRDLNADVYCLQEVVSINQLAALTATLGPDYAYIVSPFCSGATNPGAGNYPGGQKLAYIYNTNKIQNTGTFGLLASTFPSDTTGYYCFSSGRFPFIMKARLLLANGGSDTIIFANIHGKAAGTQDDYDRRLCGAEKMTDSLNALYSGKKLMVIGDYNDYIEGSMVAGNVNSPYKYLLDHGYDGITLPSLYPGQSTYVGSTDHIIDNIACSPALHIKYADSSFFIFTETFKYVENYSATTSDHFPIMSYYQFNFPNSVAEIAAGETHFSFTLKNPSANELLLNINEVSLTEIRLHIYDLSGKIIFKDKLQPGCKQARIEIPGLSKGMFFVELSNEKKKAVQKWIVE